MNAFQTLSPLEAQHRQATLPHLTSFPHTAFEDRTSLGLSFCIVTLLNLRNHFSSRCIIVKHQNGRWQVGIEQKLQADIVAVIGNRSYATSVDKNGQAFFQELPSGDMNLVISLTNSSAGTAGQLKSPQLLRKSFKYN